MGVTLTCHSQRFRASEESDAATLKRKMFTQYRSKSDYISGIQSFNWYFELIREIPFITLSLEGRGLG